MRVSLRWLRELLPEIPSNPDSIAERLTSIGLAVDAVHALGKSLTALLVVEVRGIAPHPKRDQLHLVTVNRGNGHTQQVVCGASNVPDPGGLVILAPLGAHLPGSDGPLMPRDIGGITSDGMLCSETELGVADKSDRLFIMSPGACQPGTLATVALPELDDVILDLDITPNRPDALGHIGIARDLAAALGMTFTVPKPEAVTASVSKSIEESIAIEIQDGERCPIYGAAAAEDLHIGPSPDFMRWRLHRLGIRPISNVVDITNWMLLLFGQPMHAFDWDRLRGNRIVVRRAEPGEAFSTLDGVERKLVADDLLIADGSGPTALAGVMGGLHSEISATTSRVVFECAYFAPRGVRRTARRQGLHTESSHRFERGVDWGQIETVLEHALAWLNQIAGAKRIPGVAIAKGQILERARVNLRFPRQDALLGISIPPQQSVSILERLGFRVLDWQASFVAVEVPSHRPDVTREVDLIEEVVRIYGLDQIPTRLPARVSQSRRTAGQIEQEITEIAVTLGLSEALIYGFTSERALSQVKAPAPVVYLENPLSDERNVMRTSLVPGLLEALGRARRRGEPRVRLFALGSVFLPPNTPRAQTAISARQRDAADAGLLPVEVPRFAAILAGPRASWLKKPDNVDVFEAKGMAVELIERYVRRDVSVVPAANQPHTRHLHPRGAADVLVDGQRVGWFGPLHPDVVDAFDLGDDAQLIELDLSELETVQRRQPRYQPMIRVPGIVRDVSFEVPNALPAGEIIRVMTIAAGDLCESVEPFDLFEGVGVSSDCRAIAFRLMYRDPKARTQPDEARTLTDAEVDARQLQVLDAIQRQWGIALRG